MGDYHLEHYFVQCAFCIQVSYLQYISSAVIKFTLKAWTHLQKIHSSSLGPFSLHKRITWLAISISMLPWDNSQQKHQQSILFTRSVHFSLAWTNKPKLFLTASSLILFLYYAVRMHVWCVHLWCVKYTEQINLICGILMSSKFPLTFYTGYSLIYYH